MNKDFKYIIIKTHLSDPIKFSDIITDYLNKDYKLHGNLVVADSHLIQPMIFYYN